MSRKEYRLVADIRTHDPKGIETVLRELLGSDMVTQTETGFQVKTVIEGDSARELNRSLLSALRRVEKKTTLRSEWTRNGTTWRFFDYVAKGIREG